MKRIISLAAVAMLILSLCACSAEKFSLKINNISVPEEVYNYFDLVAKNDSAYKDEKDKEKTALNLCAKYAAENELIDKYKISLSAEDKVSVASDTKSRWLYYSGFYEKNSVSKQTLNLMLEHERLVDDAIIRIYSENGDKPVSEKEIKEYYGKNYVAVQMISAALPEDEKEIEKITDNFIEMRNAVRSGEGVETAAQRYPEIAVFEGETTVISSFENSYPDGLFDNAAKMKNGETQVFRYNRAIYLIHRLDEPTENGYYSLYSRDCIIRMKKSEVEKEINTIAQNYKIVYNKG